MLLGTIGPPSEVGAAGERSSQGGWQVQAQGSPAGPFAACGSCVTVPTACSTTGALCSASASGAPVTCIEKRCILKTFSACPGSQCWHHAALPADCMGQYPCLKETTPPGVQSYQQGHHSMCCCQGARSWWLQTRSCRSPVPSMLGQHKVCLPHACLHRCKLSRHECSRDVGRAAVRALGAISIPKHT